MEHCYYLCFLLFFLIIVLFLLSIFCDYIPTKMLISTRNGFLNKCNMISLSRDAIKQLNTNTKITPFSVKNEDIRAFCCCKMCRSVRWVHSISPYFVFHRGIMGHGDKQLRHISSHLEFLTFLCLVSNFSKHDEMRSSRPI